METGEHKIPWILWVRDRRTQNTLDLMGGDRRTRSTLDLMVVDRRTHQSLDLMGEDRRTQDTLHSDKIQEPDGWVVGGLVKTNFITHSGSSELSLDSESNLEPSVAKRLN